MYYLLINEEIVICLLYLYVCIMYMGFCECEYGVVILKSKFARRDRQINLVVYGKRKLRMKTKKGRKKNEIKWHPVAILHKIKYTVQHIIRYTRDPHAHLYLYVYMDTNPYTNYNLCMK